MDWNQLYPKVQMPALERISAFVASPLWNALCTHLESCYGVFPKVEHSGYSGAPGWNVKYKKGGRTLCTLYPADGFFTCLVSVGRREAMEAELLLTAFTEYVRALYWKTDIFNGGRWLMICVTSPEILEDVKQLIALRGRRSKG